MRRGLRKLARRVRDRALGAELQGEVWRDRCSEPRASALAATTEPPEAPPTPPQVEQPGPSLSEADQALHARLVAALREVYDPEIPVNIFDLGLVYAIRIAAEGRVEVDLTLTSPACMMGPLIVESAERALRETEGVLRSGVSIVWDPPWDPKALPAATRLALGFF